MKNYTKFSLIAFVIPIALSISSCNTECLEGSGKQTTMERSVETFSSIEMGGSYKVILTQDSTSKMRITADDNIIDEIKTKVSGGVLEISMDGNICSSGDIVLEISSKEWKGLEISGASKVISSSQIKTNDFKIELSGSSSIDLDLVAAVVRTSSSGSSEIKLKGQARSHEIDLSGSGEVNAFDFVVNDYKISTSGASEMEINVMNDLKVSTSGASKIKYKGTPKNIVNDESGSSELIKVQ